MRITVQQVVKFLKEIAIMAGLQQLLHLSEVNENSKDFWEFCEPLIFHLDLARVFPSKDVIDELLDGLQVQLRGHRGFDPVQLSKNCEVFRVLSSHSADQRFVHDVEPEVPGWFVEVGEVPRPPLFCFLYCHCSCRIVGLWKSCWQLKKLDRKELDSTLLLINLSSL